MLSGTFWFQRVYRRNRFCGVPRYYRLCWRYRFFLRPRVYRGDNRFFFRYAGGDRVCLRAGQIPVFVFLHQLVIIGTGSNTSCFGENAFRLSADGNQLNAFDSLCAAAGLIYLNV
ncbi:hypothetical protein D3C76_1161810 [compost metagenome]